MKTKYQNRDPKLETKGKVIGVYEREYYCFSNFSSFAVRWRGKLWPTSEHAYQASKFIGINPEAVEEIRKSLSADAAKRIAHKYMSEIAVKNMESILRAKLMQNPYVKRKLIQTGKRKIIEDSPKDEFWGWGPDKKGRNELGKIWMKLRKELI